jgi:hypothetical protein
LTVHAGEVIAGGAFTALTNNSTGSTIPREINTAHVGRWNNAIWQPLGGGIVNGLGTGTSSAPSAVVYAMTVYNGRLVVGGRFTSAGGRSVTNIAQWDGTSWGRFGPETIEGNSINGDVYSLAVFNGELYVGGQFTTIGTTTVNFIAKWTGSAWQSVGGGMSSSCCGPGVYAMTIYDGALIAGGRFPEAGGSAAPAVARWNGLGWQPLTTGVVGNFAQCSSLAVYQNQLIVGGNFSTAGGAAIPNIASWDGSVWAGLGTGANRLIFAFAVLGNDLIIGSQQGTFGGVAANSLARWNGTAWSTLGDGLTRSGPRGGLDANALKVLSTGELVIGGLYTEAGHVPCNYISVWNGAAYSALGDGMDGTVYSLAEFNGELIAGGAFATAGGVQSASFARWGLQCACPADLDDGSMTGTPDGGVTLEDLLYFLDQYAQGATRADLDDGTMTGTRDGGVTLEDLLYFLAHFDAGC